MCDPELFIHDSDRNQATKLQQKGDYLSAAIIALNLLNKDQDADSFMESVFSAFRSTKKATPLQSSEGVTLVRQDLFKCATNKGSGVFKYENKQLALMKNKYSKSSLLKQLISLMKEVSILLLGRPALMNSIKENKELKRNSCKC